MDHYKKLQEIKSKIRGNLIMLIITIAGLYIISYGWFYLSQASSLQNLELKTELSNVVQISLDNGTTWMNQKPLDIGQDFGFYNEITGNGIDFYKPDEKNLLGEPVSFELAVKNRDYLEFDVLFRSMAPAGVFLDVESYVIPAVGLNSVDLLGSSALNKSSFGSFSKDLVAGAVRISFIEGTYLSNECQITATPNFVWAPNRNYELSLESGSYSAYIDSTNSQNYNYINVTSPTVFVEDRVLNLKDNISASALTGNANGDYMLTFSEGDADLEIAPIACMKVKVWVEGNDREAQTPLKGGQFKISLNFAAITKQFNEFTPIVTADTNLMTIDGYNSEMEYSKDYGNTWQTDLGFGFELGNTVFVRYFETPTHFASNHTEINF